MLSICAVIAARNEAQYLHLLLPMLASQGIDVAILDNGSSDGSHDLYSAYMKHPVILVEQLPYHGHFSLTEQLETKQVIHKKINHDWVIHLDADEVLEHVQPGLSLRDAIREADELGYNALNFEEFVFLPEPQADYFGKNYYDGMMQYYFFEFAKNRRNLAWQRNMPFENILSAGHTLSGDGLAISPVKHVLRHYIVLSQEHARCKYLNLIFDDSDLRKGWFTNRLGFTMENLILPYNNPCLFRLSGYDSKDFRRDRPVNKHYWEWG